MSFPDAASLLKVGTLCGASKEEVDIGPALLDLMRECAKLIGSRITEGSR